MDKEQIAVHMSATKYDPHGTSLHVVAKDLVNEPVDPKEKADVDGPTEKIEMDKDDDNLVNEPVDPKEKADVDGPTEKIETDKERTNVKPGHPVDSKKKDEQAEEKMHDDDWLDESADLTLTKAHIASTPQKNFLKKLKKQKTPAPKQMKCGIDPKIEMLIENNRINIENMERVFMERAEMAEERYNKLEEAFNKLRKYTESSQAKYEKEIHESRSRYEKKLEELNNRVENDCLVISEQKTEIAVLRGKINHQNQLQQIQNSIDSELKNVEVRLQNKVREEKTNRENAETATQNQLEILQTQMKKKALQSDLDKIREINKTPKLSKETIIKPIIPIVEENKADDNPNIESTSENNEPEEIQATQRKKIKENVVLLMDSNRKPIEEDLFWNRTKKIRVSSAAELEKIIDGFDFQNAEHIIIGTGTNDTDERSANEIFPDLIKGVKKLQEKYNTNIYVSQIPPRLKERREVVQELNLLIERGLPESINVILQNRLEPRHFRDEKHDGAHRSLCQTDER